MANKYNSINPWGYQTSISPCYVNVEDTLQYNVEALQYNVEDVYSTPIKKRVNRPPASSKSTRDDYTPSVNSVYILQSKSWV